MNIKSAIMKKMIRLLFLFVTVSLLISCASRKAMMDSQAMILPLGDTLSIKEGSLIYGLPMTVFTAVVEMELTIEKPGPYARFAGEMLGLKDVITQESEEWAIRNIKLVTSQELDPSEFFIIQSNTLVQTNALSLRKAGLIMDINPLSYDKNENTAFNENSVTDQTRFMDLGADEYYINQNDTTYRMVKLDTSFIKIPYLIEKKRQLSIDQLAEKAAKTLLELRDGKHLILTGEANVFPQNSAAIEEMNRLEREYTALFAGKVITERKSIFYTLIPQKEMSGKPFTLFRFSDLTGATDASSTTGVPVTVDLLPANKTKGLSYVSRPVNRETSAKKFDKLFYRIPDVVTVKIKMGKEELYNSRKLIYQFGEVVQLPANYIIGK
jgi:hypothetical protein